MGLDEWAARLSKHRRAVALVGLITAFTGVSMVLNPTHAVGIEWSGLPVLVAGFALFVWVVWPQSSTAAPRQTLGARFLRWITWHGRLARLFPVAGVALVAADLAYNLFLSASPALLTEDILVLLTAAALVGHGLVPERYARERDFVLLFFVILDASLVAPLLIARVLIGNVEASVDLYSWIALAPELSAILSGLGVPNAVHSVAGFTAPGLTFTPLQMTQAVTLVITTSCSGIYSFGIFASAYIAFLLTDYERPSRRLWLLIGLGFLSSYAANLLRMVVIVLVGYYTDSAQTDLQNLLFAHSYVGWVTFLIWIALFWSLLFRFLPIEKETAYAGLVSGSELIYRPKESQCSICAQALTVAIPAARCVCGAMYHRGCLLADGRCVLCHRDVVGRFAGLSDSSQASPP